MSLGTLVKRTVHSATRAPRLYAAALRAGVGPSGAVEVLQISGAAMKTAAAYGRGVPGRANAMRHFLWQALLTARLGRPVAVDVARSQELGTPSLRDSEVDGHNNRVGQDHGEAHARELSRGSVSEAMVRLVPVALQKWEAGELVWVKPH